MNTKNIKMKMFMKTLDEVTGGRYGYIIGECAPLEHIREKFPNISFSYWVKDEAKRHRLIFKGDNGKFYAPSRPNVISARLAPTPEKEIETPRRDALILPGKLENLRNPGAPSTSCRFPSDVTEKH